ncbi:methyl-accepting chemotaxis protein [Thioclava sp. GXIMD4216]|uniref:methyl-accepting chemotaxis protein n=1 Tax=Thioclava sp. GXIMD4216 TaxID=3131929 RepID=UPI0030D0F7B1
MRVIKTVSGKLILAAGTAITMIVLAYTVFSGWSETRKVHDQVMNLAEIKTRRAAEQVMIPITQATSAATALSSSLAGYLATGEATTKGLTTVLHDLAPQYDDIFASWMNELEGRTLDGLASGTEGRNEKGDFAAFWTKNDSGGMDFQTYSLNPTAQWYAGPTSTKRGLITDPYLTEKGILLTSVVIPVVVKGTMVGLAGADITLDNLSTILGAIDTFEGGRMMLLDAGAKWVVAPTPDEKRKPYEGAGLDAVNAALEDGKMHIISDMPDGATRLVLPFSAPGMNRTWAAVLDVPAATFSGPVHAAIKASILSGLLILLMALTTIALATSTVVRKPMQKMLDVVKGLAEGQYDHPVPGTDRHDEMGQMATAVEALRNGLLEKRALEVEQELARQEREIERERRTQEDARLREEREERAQADQEREHQAILAEEANRRRQEEHRAALAAEQEAVVKRLAGSLSGLAEGNLDVMIHERFPQGYDQLRQDFNNTVLRLSELVQAITQSANAIVGGVQEITGAATGLSRETERSAATLEQTAAALNELTVSVQTASASATQANNLVKDAAQNAKETAGVVGDTITAIDEIRDSSNHISRIISVIDDIAFQTNLLALNAGVEAARAGDAGRGFAVVASEVRGLAQRSSEAALEINALISKSGVQVENGVALVNRAGDALRAIVKSVEVIEHHMGDIASSANEQASGISEINSAVGQLDRAQQQNAASFEETSAACLALDQQAHELKDLVGQFRLGSADAPITQAA